MNTHSHTRPYMLTLSDAHTHTLSCNMHTHTLTHTFSHIHTHAHTLYSTRAQSLTHCHTHTQGTRIRGVSEQALPCARSSTSYLKERFLKSHPNLLSTLYFTAFYLVFSLSMDSHSLA